jgi:alcohol dehydrogenase class IV
MQRTVTKRVLSAGAAVVGGLLSLGYALFQTVGSWPHFAEYYRFRREFGNEHWGCTVTVGGGQVIDTGKLIATNVKDAEDLCGCESSTQHRNNLVRRRRHGIGAVTGHAVDRIF